MSIKTTLLIIIATIIILLGLIYELEAKKCTFKGKKLYGRIKIVNSFPDIRVKIVSAFPNLRIQRVSSWPDKCGKWQFVSNFPNLRVQFVTSNPDLLIAYTPNAPGWSIRR